MTRFQIGGKAVRGLADDLNVANNMRLHQLVGIKLRLGHGHGGGDLCDGVKYILQQ
jgi:hypothetical protein